MSITHCPACHSLLEIFYYSNQYTCSNKSCSFDIVYQTEEDKFNIKFYSIYLDLNEKYLFVSEQDENKTSIIKYTEDIKSLNAQVLLTLEGFTPVSEMQSQLIRCKQLLSFI